jgi:hypothetical protein
MKHRRLIIWLLCALFLFSILACAVSGHVDITVVVPDYDPPGPPPHPHPHEPPLHEPPPAEPPPPPSP